MAKKHSSAGMVILFGIIGLLFGLPLSYFFQPQIVRKIPLGQYLKAIPEMMTSSQSNDRFARMLGDLITPIILSCLICAFILGIVGYFIAKSHQK